MMVPVPGAVGEMHEIRFPDSYTFLCAWPAILRLLSPEASIRVCRVNSEPRGPWSGCFVNDGPIVRLFVRGNRNEPKWVTVSSEPKNESPVSEIWSVETKLTLRDPIEARRKVKGRIFRALGAEFPPYAMTVVVDGKIIKPEWLIFPEGASVTYENDAK